jgi:TRAP-type mannitol/chloroaromatic compound transport system substrate-binding protein
MDQTVLLSWFYQGEGQELYQELYQEILGQDIVAFVLCPEGPEALGWYKEPLETLEEFKQQRFRVSSGLATLIYKEMGASPVNMSGTEIIPALERGVLDGGEWINPATDIKMGFHDILKFYCAQGLHQAISLGELIVNGEAWRELPPDIQMMVEVTCQAAFIDWQTFNIKQNSDALHLFKTVHGVTVFPAPPGYAEEFTAAVNVVMAELAAEYPFFKKVLDSQKAYAKTVVPYETEVNRLYALLGAATYE